ncbi:MAG: hypothetical protein K5666_05175 [Bacilli bacterium]|nr:hypothetical protein [Bacilli bacterium]
MRNITFNKIKLLIIAIVLVLAVALFKMNLNSNTLYYRTQELFNKMGWFQNREGIIGQLTVSSPSYYGENLTEPLEDNTNYVNKVKEVRFGLTTQGIENPEDVMYAIIYDNSNNDSPYTEDRYPDEIYDPQNPNGRKKVRLKYASALDVKNADILDNQGIVNNDGKYSVLYRDNTIVIEDKGLIPYIGGNDSENTHKWVGILVDLNVKVRGTGNYNIENVDYTDATRWGAKSETTFVMWLNTEKGGTYTFANIDDETNTFELNVQFTQQAISLKSATKVDNEFENKDKYSVEYVNNKITVIDDALTSYVKDGTEESQKWVGIQIDLGVASEIVGDNNVIIEDIENSNSFIMWVSKENAGTYTFKNVEYPDDTVDVKVEFTQRKIELKSATKISTTNFDENVDNPGVLANADKYTVAYANNTITINDKGLTKYQLYEDENENKYVGILIDLGVKVQGVEESSYNEALHFGATNDTTFILWLTTSQGGVFTYKNDEYPTDKVNLNIEFTHDEIALTTFTPIDVTNADQSETNIVQNSGKYTSTINENTVTIYDDGVIPYIGGNIETPAKWMGFIVDFGVKVQGTQNYNIEDIDYESARRWGATTDTAFVMWVTPNKAGTVKFANVYYPEDEITLTLNFTHKEIALTTFTPIDVTNADQSETNIVQNSEKYTSTINENTVTIYDDGVIPYIGGNIETPAKWMGFIVDFGVKVQGTQNYNIEDVDYEAARRWGATTDTAFVMWVTPNKAGTVKFANTYYPEDEITLTLNFTHKEIALTTFTPIDVTNADQNETNIVQNSGKYTSTINENTVTITDNGVIP